MRDSISLRLSIGDSNNYLIESKEVHQIKETKGKDDDGDKGPVKVEEEEDDEGSVRELDE